MIHKSKYQEAIKPLLKTKPEKITQQKTSNLGDSMNITHSVIGTMLKLKHTHKYTLENVERTILKKTQKFLFWVMSFKLIFIFIIFYIFHGIYKNCYCYVYVHVFMCMCLFAYLCMCLYVCVFLTIAKKGQQREDLSLHERNVGHIKKIISSHEVACICLGVISSVKHRSPSSLLSYFIAIRNR